MLYRIGVHRDRRQGVEIAMNLEEQAMSQKSVDAVRSLAEACTASSRPSADSSAQAQAGSNAMILRKWYFCVNEAGFDGSRPLIAAAVASCLANTSLRPFGIYNGNDASHVSWLEARGVTVVRHRSSLEDDLRLAYGDRFNQFSGHWLRIDLPLIETEEEAVLYTDNDVMFLREPEINAVPRLLSAAPEFELTKLSYFNSGVMVLNLPSLRRVHEAFTGAIRRRLRGDFRYPAHDQESYNRFFGPRVLNRLQGRTFTPMSPTLNWKPYWGLNPEAQIVHFHGPKPRHIQKFVATEGPSAVSDLYRTLWRRSPETYAVYVAQWGTYLGELGRRRAKVAKVVEVPTLRNG